jgi:hypothetical protein
MPYWLAIRCRLGSVMKGWCSAYNMEIPDCICTNRVNPAMTGLVRSSWLLMRVTCEVLLGDSTHFDLQNALFVVIAGGQNPEQMTIV